MNRLAARALVALVLSFSIFGQSTPPNTPRGVLEGSVVDSVTGQPIEGVQVAIITGQAFTEEATKALLRDQTPTLQAPQVTKTIPPLLLGDRTLMPERTAHTALTDVRGRFILNNLAAGDYSLSLRADGHNFQVYGQKAGSLAALPIEIRDAKVDIGVIRLNPPPQISGRIVNVDGLPVATIPVYLLNGQPYIDVDGQRQFRAAGETLTDSAGRYVLEKIPAGRYYIAAGGFGQRELIRYSAAPSTPGERSGVRIPAVQPHPFTYYPGVLDIGLAGLVEAPGGAKLVLPDMLMAKADLKTIRGRVVDYATGKPPESVRVVLNARFPFLRAGRGSTEILSTGSYDRSTGVFEFANLIPGQYRVDALLTTLQNSPRSPGQAPPPNVSPQSAFQLLELRNIDVRDLVLSLPGIGGVTGKVLVTDGKPLPVAEMNLPIPLQLMLRPLNPLQPAPIVTAVSTEDGSFDANSALEGKYRFTVGPLRDNYFVSEARLNGAPVQNGILDIPGNTSNELVLSLAVGGQIQGTVVDKTGQVVPQAQGLVLPDPLPEVIAFYRNFQANTSGSFTVDGVPPGNYRVYIWESIDPSQFFDRDLLARSRGRAVLVHVNRGSSGSVSVPTIAQ